ncbi:sirohydrochlorin chelatase [Halospeciosus flavus]|uniref:CbiX/SirB N-terminal domain-containing protein n=1 Tax=Halospeciosus flavus TaxID=3032283 RepID=A0ABD5Z0E9_9EURY|nr:sirohydrochlorin chelatase [Halospeciosus flavus]
MTRDALVLLGRDTTNARETLDTHARRLRERGVADEVRTIHYEYEPQRDLRDGLAVVDAAADRVFAVPMTVAHTRETATDVPGALSRLDADVRYCEPVGRSAAVTTALRERAVSAWSGPGHPEALALVALGSSSRPHYRQVADYHAERLREHHDEVTTGYLVQNPAAECLRYTLDADRAVAVPFFVTGGDATERDVPERLELDRGGLDYAAPLGTHPRVTDAVEAALAEQRVLAEREDETTFEQSLTADAPALATDGKGR